MKISVVSSKGNRSANEDSILVAEKVISGYEFYSSVINSDDSEAHLFAIADGMGGESMGAESSRLTLMLFREKIKGFEAFFYEENCVERLKSFLSDAIKQVQTEVSSFLDSNDAFGGTTLSVLIVKDDFYLTCNLGDSPILLKRHKQFTEIFERHTLAQELLDFGVPEKEIGEEDFHCLTQCIGSGNFVDISFKDGRLEEDDVLIVASDGFEMLKKRHMMKMIKNDNYLLKPDNYVNLPDNMSVIIIKN